MKKILIGVVIVIAFAGGLLLGRLDMSMVGAAFISATVDDISLALGDPAPDFDLPGVDGERHRLADYADADVLAVVFTCNHCPTAQAYEERLKALRADYSLDQFALVAISPNDDKAVRLDELGYTDLNDSLAEMKIRARDAGFNFPYLYDGANQSASRAYGPLATPHVFVFDRERKLRYKGRVDNNENPQKVRVSDTRNAIDALLTGSEPAVTTTRVFGCSIKWADKQGQVAEKEAEWAGEKVALDMLPLDAVVDKVSHQRDDWRLINVWATWCAPCKKEFPDLVDTYRMYRGRGLEVITISLDGVDDRNAALAFLQQQQASMTNYLSASTEVEVLAKVLDPGWLGAVPYTLLIAPGGTVVYRHHGPFDPLTLRRAIVDRLGRTYF